MPTVYEASFDGSNTVRYFHISLVRLYLDQAHDNARASISADPGDELVASITSVMFSTMAIEAFVNEISVDILEKDELNDFIRLRSPYKMEKGEGSVCAKLRIMFDKKFNYKLEKQLTQQIIKLANYRNNLVHYKLSDTAGKLIMPPIKHTQLEDGGAISTIDFMAKPKRFEPSFVNSINSKSAVSGFNTALSVILKWGKLSGVDDCIPGLSIID